jgi:hypothetical protein
MDTGLASRNALTFPSFQIDGSAAILVVLLVLLIIILYCEKKFPQETARAFNLRPDDLPGINATKLILLDITVLALFLLDVWQILNGKLK